MGWISREKLSALQALVKGMVADAALSDPETLLHEAVLAAKSESKRRKHRGSIFQYAGLFGEPAWDILLELFINGADAKKTSISAIGIDAAVSPSTIKRWISLLEKHDLVVIIPDVADRRRQWLELTQETRLAMIRYFSQVLA